MISRDPVVRHETDCDIEGGEFGSVTWRTLISADRTPTDSMVVGVAEIPPGATDQVRRHRHEPPEIYYVLEGEGAVTIGETERSLRRGCVAFIPSNAWHVERNTGDTTLRILYTFATDSFTDIIYEFESPNPSEG